MDRDRDSGEDDADTDTVIYTSRSGARTTASLRTRLLANGHQGNGVGGKGGKSISTTPGLLGAGETETEGDEPVSTIYLSACM